MPAMGFAMVMAVLSGLQAAGQDWTAGGTRDGVAVSFRDHPQLGAREVRAVSELPHAAARIAAIACDFTQPLDPDVREARLRSGDLSARYAIYLRYAPRYLVVAARDVVIDVQRDATGCSWSEVPDAMERRDDAVRMPVLRGSWRIEPLGESRARVTYQVAVDPGGRIPKWLVRRGAAGALPDAIARLRQRLDNAAAVPLRCSAEMIYFFTGWRTAW